MRESEKFILVKRAELIGEIGSRLSSPSNLARATGIAATLPFIPWNSMRSGANAVTGDGHKDEIPQSIIADGGRMIGAGIGGMTAHGLHKTWGLPTGSPWMRAAMLLGGVGVGSTLGQMRGRSVGETLFPGTFGDRIHRALNNF